MCYSNWTLPRSERFLTAPRCPAVLNRSPSLTEKSQVSSSSVGTVPWQHTCQAGRCPSRPCARRLNTIALRLHNRRTWSANNSLTNTSHVLSRGPPCRLHSYVYTDRPPDCKWLNPQAYAAGYQKSRPGAYSVVFAPLRAQTIDQSVWT